MSFTVTDPQDIAVVIEVFRSYLADEGETLEEYLTGSSMAPGISDLNRLLGLEHRRRSVRLYIAALEAKEERL